ncbi:pilus assembly protein TadB [Paenibacillus mesophilus]|uniref:type II secretion system F family protein n=1 Tax=Paenibacillus mesophilus TaxID=2582849 RepID=UPI00110DDA57|nr:type II secretion system F family protein [Paenibacillus mesophilus]TMV50262.1 pilus assembly protein TadB [Paenibacillus mesophilus]
MGNVIIALACGAVAYAIYVLLGKKEWRRILPKLRPLRLSGKRTPVDTRSSEPGYYDQYMMAGAEKASACLIAGTLLFAIGFLFYKNALICLVISFAAVGYPRLRRKQLIRRRKEELRRQFKHALYSLSSALSAGRSVENAFREAGNDLRLLYPDSSTDMIRELDRLNRRTENGEPIEKSLLDFGRRSGIEDIMQFADAFAACKRTGGDLVEVMRRTTHLIGEKMEIEQDISVMVAQKRFEAKALGFIPFVIVAFLAFSSPDYMEPLYGGAGHLVMTASLVILAASQWLAHKIMDIGA